eukprot:GFUD01014906.1.p1 GENE.GFUD01014906.1~~GFUD01014906.1.p1  ORF type:complete len:664 (+),score=220.39 GFUD01014906.1:118-2109(+)
MELLSLLTPGHLDRLMDAGQRPDSLTVQVLGTKEIGNKKFRLFVWDGKTEYKGAVMDLLISNLAIPAKFSIVKVSDTDRPDELAEHTVKSYGGGKFALVLHHYTMVREGGLVGRRLGSSSSQANGHSQPVVSQAATPPSHNTPQSHSTPPFAAATPSLRPPPPKIAPSPSHLNRQNVKRNLESAYGAPAPKRGPGDNPTHQVTDLNPYINKYKLKVRVDTKSPVRNLTTQKFTGSVQDCVVSDQSGSIKVTAWASQGREDTAHLDTLEVGSTYMLEGLMVKPVFNQRFNTTGHNYELTWGQNTVASGPYTDNPIKQTYKFVPISSLPDTPADTVVDLVAWVKEMGDLIQFRSKAEKDFKKREVVLADNSMGGSSVNLVLWAEQAEQFNHLDAIIAIKGAKVAEFNGNKNISLGFSGTFEVAPEVPEAEELEEWASGLRGHAMIPSQSSQGGRVAGEWSTLQEIKELLAENRTEKKFTVLACPIKVKTDNMWYRAHQPRDGKVCRKKVTENAANPELYDCKCGDKKLSEGETELRYMVSLCLADCTSWIWATMFSASSLFNMTAQELHDLRIISESNFLELVTKVQFTEAVFSVTAKVETYNQSPQLKFNIQDMEHLGWGEEGGKDHIKRRWMEVMRLEEELGVSHEEEYGIAVSGTAAYPATS